MDYSTKRPTRRFRDCRALSNISNQLISCKPAAAGALRKPLPPFAPSIEWKRKQSTGFLLTVYAGSDSVRSASREVEAERRWSGDRPTLFCALPFNHQPAQFDWRFVAGFNVAVITYGTSESDLLLLHLVKLLVAAGTEVVAVTLSVGRFELFKRDDQGGLWRLN